MAKKEKRTTCKFDMSRTGFTDEHGRMQSYSMCTMCGKWHKGQYGIFIDARVPDKRYGGNATEFNIRKKLCRKCAKELSEEILNLCDKLFWARPKEDTSELGKKIKEVQNHIFDNLYAGEETQDNV